MAGVNLRIATLKNANLQNCDLRAAVLAGADLEVHIFFLLSLAMVFILFCSFLNFTFLAFFTYFVTNNRFMVFRVTVCLSL
jgi:uncharacterized protein YjbI with pentapeptide repeats